MVGLLVYGFEVEKMVGGLVVCIWIDSERDVYKWCLDIYFVELLIVFWGNGLDFICKVGKLDFFVFECFG